MEQVGTSAYANLFVDLVVCFCNTLYEHNMFIYVMVESGTLFSRQDQQITYNSSRDFAEIHFKALLIIAL